MQIIQIFSVAKNLIGYFFPFFNNYRKEKRLRTLKDQLRSEAQELLNQINQQGINNQQIREETQEIYQQLEMIYIQNSTQTEEQLNQKMARVQTLLNQIQQDENQNEELQFETFQIKVRIELNAPKHIMQIFQRYPANFQYSYYFNILYKGTDEDQHKLTLVKLQRNNFNNRYLNPHIQPSELQQISRSNHCIFYLKVNEEEQFSRNSKQRVQLYVKTESPNGLELIRENQIIQIQPNIEVVLKENDRIQIIKLKISYVVKRFEYEFLSRGNE